MAADLHRRHPLDCLFTPTTIAVIGATDREGSLGRTVLHNLAGGTHQRQVWAVNPKHKELLGVPCYSGVAGVPEKVDLAVIVTPAASVPKVVRECVAAGVRSAIVISAGFKEMGADGAALERQIQEELRHGPMRLVGPNCLGVMNPWSGMNATFARDIARPGNVALLSQSGALLAAILDWSFQEEVGFSAVVSTGSMLDVDWGDLISYYGEDPRTHSILLYMESVGNARSFLSAAREVALNKPVIVIKAGRTQAASRAASSHTGALTGSDEVFDAALRRCGVLRVQNISDLFYMADLLSKQPRPRGPRLTIVTNAGGPGVLATDALIANGGELAELSEQSIRALNAFLPPHWSHANPIDILADGRAERYARTLEIAFADPSSDGLLVIAAPQGMADPTEVAQLLKPYAKGRGKPALASWMGGKGVEKGRAILHAAGIPAFAYPDTAARAFAYMWLYTDNLRGLYETPAVADSLGAAEFRQAKAAALLQSVLQEGRTVLTEVESKELLSLYEIPGVLTRVAASADQAASLADELGYPAVLKVFSKVITHKTDVGGVQLDLRNAEAVRNAFREIESSVRERAGAGAFLGVTIQPMVRRDGYELILGSSVDPLFGPVLLFGSGGNLVEVYGDRALALPPLTTTLAQRMMEQTRIFRALQGTRGRAPVDLMRLEALLVRFSELIVELPRIFEFDINPLFVSAEGEVALDARVVLADPKITDEELPRPAIRPYPLHYVSTWEMKDGTKVTIRPIRPEDEPLMVKFHESLSEQTVYLRYLHIASVSARAAHDRLVRKCFIDYDREMALVAESSSAGNSGPAILGVARLTRLRNPTEAEIAVIVADKYQKHGLGGELIRRIVHVARRENITRLVAHFLPGNSVIQDMAIRYGATIHPTQDPDSVRAELVL